MDSRALLDVLKTERAMAIMRSISQEAALHAMTAAVEGGFQVVEFTLTTPGAFELITSFSHQSSLVVGAGSVLNLEQARAAADAGAAFLVSPVTDLDVLAFGIETGIAVIPGAATPTEMFQAHQAGATAVKVFPKPAHGPDTLRAILRPMPFLKLIPTHGVTGRNARSYLAAGAFAVAFTGILFQPADMHAGRFDRIKARAYRFLEDLQLGSNP